MRPVGALWQVTRDGAPAFTVITKATAVAEGKRQAREAAPSLLVLHAADDSVESELVYEAVRTVAPRAIRK